MDEYFIYLDQGSVAYSLHQTNQLFLDCLLKNFSVFFNVYNKSTEHHFIKCENYVKFTCPRPHTVLWGHSHTPLFLDGLRFPSHD